MVYSHIAQHKTYSRDQRDTEWCTKGCDLLQRHLSAQISRPLPFKQSCDLKRSEEGLLLPLTFKNPSLTKRDLLRRKKKHLKQIIYYLSLPLSQKPIGIHFSIFINSTLLIQNPAQKDCYSIKYHHITLDNNKACLHACLHQTPHRVVPFW